MRTLLDELAEREIKIKRGQAILDERIQRKEKGNGKDGEAVVIVEEEPAEAPWPALDGIAYQGLAGEIVNFIAPQSESDKSALLVQILTAFGAMVGHEAWYQVESTLHFPNLFALLVGDTSKARKGTSWDRVRTIFGW